MVDLALLQSLSYVAGALGVCIGGLSFAFNTRTTNKNRKVSFTTGMLSTLDTMEGMRCYRELMAMEWTDFEDFKRKYDSTVNTENSLKRTYFWNLIENIGWQLRNGLIDFDTVFFSQGVAIYRMWRKFSPIINEYKKSEYALDAYAHWEYLNGRVEEKMSEDAKRKTQYQLEHSYKSGGIRAG